jgi:hypothetical protein
MRPASVPSASCIGNSGAITSLKIDLVGIDPFIKAHATQENDNDAIDEVCNLLLTLADEFNFAPDVIHHSRKGAASPGDADRSRGASALVDAGRLIRTVTRMSEEEATTFGVTQQERACLIRADDAKVNLAPRSADAMWFKIIGVPLGNGTDDYPSGDIVQTVERWKPRDLFADISISIANQIIDRIEAGPYEGGRYSPSPNAQIENEDKSPGRAAWPVITEFCPALSDKQAKAIISTWIKTGVLVKRDHEDPRHRHNHPSLFVGKRPGNTWES